ncbi:hypothetical protein TNCV_5061211 [Trichonephila clavipes]|nr:hypothetical protein TNCV_5061211 [Trichonephila clavipes]
MYGEEVMSRQMRNLWYLMLRDGIQSVEDKDLNVHPSRSSNENIIARTHVMVCLKDRPICYLLASKIITVMVFPSYSPDLTPCATFSYFLELNYLKGNPFYYS